MNRIVRICRRCVRYTIFLLLLFRCNTESRNVKRRAKLKKGLEKRRTLCLLLFIEAVVVASVGKKFKIAYHGKDFRIGEIAILIHISTYFHGKENVLFIYNNNSSIHPLDSFLPAIVNRKHDIRENENCSIATAIISCFVKSCTS